MWVDSVNFTFFFWHAQKPTQNLYLRDSNITIYRKLNCNFATLFQLFYLICKFFNFLAILLVRKLHELSLWIIYHFLGMSRSLSINFCLRSFSIAIYGNMNLHCFYLLRLFSGLYIVQFWSINYAFHYGIFKIRKHCLHWNVFCTNIYKKIIFNCLLPFKLFLVANKLYKLSQ